ncbi:MAG: beta-galactosidase [Candidatus Uhrbacteria bacterium]
MRRRTYRILIIVVFCAAAFYVALFFVRPADAPQTYGVTFTKSYAEYLGVDWRAAYLALLDDLDVRRVRLGAYWPEIEPTAGQYTFDDLDWMMDEAAKHDAEVVLAIGVRLPRWPECHIPDWVNTGQEPKELAIRGSQGYPYAEVVEQYRHHPALAMWQVENEPFLRIFGACPRMDGAYIDERIALVRGIDTEHPILITDSGELSTWQRTARRGDRFGTTMYRIVWNPIIKYWRYDHILPPALYRVKAYLAGQRARDVVIAELQAEPWVPAGNIRDIAYDELQPLFTTDDFEKNIAFAKATGFGDVYLWGAEYWYWLREVHGDPSLWDAARELLRPEQTST